MDIKIKQVSVHARRTPRGRTHAADWRKYHGNAIVYFDVEGESIWDHLANRRRRPHLEYRKLLPEVIKQLGLPEDTKARWNVKAGCKVCPCSPGFVLDRQVRADSEGNLLTTHDGFPANVYVTITGEEHPRDYDPAKIAQQVMNLEIVEVPS